MVYLVETTPKTIFVASLITLYINMTSPSSSPYYRYSTQLNLKAKTFGNVSLGNSRTFIRPLVCIGTAIVKILNGRRIISRYGTTEVLKIATVTEENEAGCLARFHRHFANLADSLSSQPLNLLVDDWNNATSLDNKVHLGLRDETFGTGKLCFAVEITNVVSTANTRCSTIFAVSSWLVEAEGAGCEKREDSENLHLDLREEING